ncbi:MAG: zinc ribbon domain-containing protein [Chloroflexi bacterium]|nr:zinc ribbon domain-containing protein [Chloroflexota bacterium]
MDLGFIFTSLALFILVAAFVARPLIEKMSGVEAEKTHADDLFAQREAILIELRDVDFDHETGKMNDDDYKEQRARLTTKGVEVLRALDSLKTEEAAPPVNTLDDDIENLIAVKRGKKVAKPLPSNGKTHQDEAADKFFCTQCGTAARADDKFCAKCGAQLQKVWQD